MRLFWSREIESQTRRVALIGGEGPTMPPHRPPQPFEPPPTFPSTPRPPPIPSSFPIDPPHQLYHPVDHAENCNWNVHDGGHEMESSLHLQDSFPLGADNGGRRLGSGCGWGVTGPLPKFGIFPLDGRSVARLWRCATATARRGQGILSSGKAISVEPRAGLYLAV